MTKPIQIRKDDVVRDIRELASLTQKPITEAVAEAVRRELLRARLRTTSVAERQRQIDEIVAHVRSLPRTGETLTDDDLYDENGLPR